MSNFMEWNPYFVPRSSKHSRSVVLPKSIGKALAALSPSLVLYGADNVVWVRRWRGTISDWRVHLNIFVVGLSDCRYIRAGSPNSYVIICSLYLNIEHDIWCSYVRLKSQSRQVETSGKHANSRSDRQFDIKRVLIFNIKNKMHKRVGVNN